MKFWLNLLVSIDQFFNTVAGGNPDVTVSSHCYTMTYVSKDYRWLKLRNIIDYTFKPIEKQHCYLAWRNDEDEDETENLIRTSIVAIVGCAILFIPIRLLSLFGVKNGTQYPTR
jgi:hypothetical protein